MTRPIATDRPAFAETRRAFLEGTRSPREHLEAYLEAIEKAEPTVKAFATLDADGARAAADASAARYRAGRPLSAVDGMVVGVKDIMETADLPTGMNSPLFDGYRAKADAAAVRAVRDGGGVVVGKTVTTEYAIGRSGPTRNPLSPDHTPGGSSSGSAAGAAAGFFDAAFGTQTQGSIIRPASFCGVVGFKPTLNALSTAGIHPLSRTLDHLGTIAARLDDAWTLAREVSERAPQHPHRGLDGPAGPLPRLAPSRVAVLRTAGFDELDADTAAAFEAALARLAACGVSLAEPADDPALAAIVRGLDDVGERSIDVLAFEMLSPYADYLAARPDDLGPRLHELVERGRSIDRATVRGHLAVRDDLRAKVAALSDTYDAFVLPAASEPAPEGLDYTGRRTLLVYWTFLGLPAFSLPLMTVRGLPLGLQVAGFENADHRLARHCSWLMEAASG